jgi:multidrug efflux pump subunit AcrB
MIALVRIALSRPYTFVVLALLLLIIGPLAALRTPTDIFPDIRIPVIGVVWNYTGCRRIRCRGASSRRFSGR